MSNATSVSKDPPHGRSMGKVFVWIPGLTGFEPQIWEKDLVEVFAHRNGKPVFKQELTTDEYSLTLVELIEKYPSPAAPTPEPKIKLTTETEITTSYVEL